MAAVSRGHSTRVSGEGPNTQTQGTTSRLASGMRQNTRQLAFDWEAAGETQPRPSQGSMPPATPCSQGTLAHGRLRLRESPGADPHAGWCGGRGSATAPPTRSHGGSRGSQRGKTPSPGGAEYPCTRSGPGARRKSIPPRWGWELRETGFPRHSRGLRYSAAPRLRANGPALTTAARPPGAGCGKPSLAVAAGRTEVRDRRGHPGCRTSFRCGDPHCAGRCAVRSRTSRLHRVGRLAGRSACGPGLGDWRWSSQGHPR